MRANRGCLETYHTIQQIIDDAITRNEQIDFGGRSSGPLKEIKEILRRRHDELITDCELTYVRIK